MVMNFFLAMSLSLLLILLNSLIAKKAPAEREKPSAFECGFEPKSSARLPFSLRFYLIAVVFLIFDVEITLLLPLPILIKFSNLATTTAISMMFILILAGGLYHEWSQGALNWK